jgi:hypothetical protein
MRTSSTKDARAATMGIIAANARKTAHGNARARIAFCGV